MLCGYLQYQSANFGGHLFFPDFRTVELNQSLSSSRYSYIAHVRGIYFVFDKISFLFRAFIVLTK